ncbi:hypothetical protein SporoP37_11285 [Sporosarcina sp. P37]|nr:hypothetical protein SporoP33_10875 [Sporosarcina sp. P33]ARK25180.1 hypothetical protein SporoP37_11285 [Sporosarcina sp. P37]
MLPESVIKWKDFKTLFSNAERSHKLFSQEVKSLIYYKMLNIKSRIVVQKIDSELRFDFCFACLNTTC